MRPADGATASLFPLLFITIACGACSGFHSLIASGTTSKQLRVETDARLVGYGAMLLEAMVAIVSLCCVMMFAAGSKELHGRAEPDLRPGHRQVSGSAFTCRDRSASPSP